VAGPVEATVLGNVLVQARANGEIGSLEDLRTVVLQSSDMDTFEPELTHAASWADARGKFSKLTGSH